VLEVFLMNNSLPIILPNIGGIAGSVTEFIDIKACSF
jgi:hypothetical protein